MLLVRAPLALLTTRLAVVLLVLLSSMFVVAANMTEIRRARLHRPRTYEAGMQPTLTAAVTRSSRAHPMSIPPTMGLASPVRKTPPETQQGPGRGKDRPPAGRRPVPPAMMLVAP